jgi:hypothetical protein
VKVVCQFIGAQAQVDPSKHGGRNPLVDAAMAVSIFGEKSAEELELERIRGPQVAARLEDDERFAQRAADPEAGVEASNAAGSYEAFMAMMGGPPPMPGRG